MILWDPSSLPPALTEAEQSMVDAVRATVLLDHRPDPGVVTAVLGMVQDCHARHMPCDPSHVLCTLYPRWRWGGLTITRKEH